VIRTFDLANAISLLALLAAAACCWLSISQLPVYGIIALMVAGIADVVDGQVARRLRRTEELQRFGKNIDSLVDACSFGLAPVTLLYAIGLNQLLDLLLLGFFLCCAIWRLAYFDTFGMETTGSNHYFVGLPTTYVALVLPLVFLTAFAGAYWLWNCLRMAMLLLALAMVSQLRCKKPGLVVYAFIAILAIGVGSLLVWYAPQLHLELRRW
jgi:CDP-diacylglycerol--serine O-phosphatidyltransferase